MTTKHTPATPLPWIMPGTDGGEYVICSDGSKGKRRTVAHGYEPTNAAYIAHAANAYPKLVEALREIRTTTLDRACVPIIEEVLRELGEE